MSWIPKAIEVEGITSFGNAKMLVKEYAEELKLNINSNIFRKDEYTDCGKLIHI